MGENKQFKIVFFFLFSLISNFIISFINQQNRESGTHWASLKFCFEQNGFCLFHIHAQAALFFPRGGGSKDEMCPSVLGDTPLNPLAEMEAAAASDVPAPTTCRNSPACVALKQGHRRSCVPAKNLGDCSVWPCYRARLYFNDHHF